MYRKITEKLKDWQTSSIRKPLILQGARQVGKTYVANEFGKKYYENVVYCQLESDENVKSCFETLEPKEIIGKISNLKKQDIFKEKTLIIFDEVQSLKGAITSLKYFCEMAHEYHIISLGSLLGVAVNRDTYSYPVGKVDTMELNPLDFEEFLIANNKSDLLEKIYNCYKSFYPMEEFYHNEALKYFRLYLYIGGMPEIVNLYLQNKNENLVKIYQSEIVNAYLNDMSKYNKENMIAKTRIVYKNLSVQLAKENKKFKYNLIKTGARSSEFEEAIEWLSLSGIAKMIYGLEHISLPLNANKDIKNFKLYANDVGLLLNLEDVTLNDINYGNEKLKEFYGGLVENYVFNQLNSNDLKLYYYLDETMEIDFITKLDDEIMPIEVKSGERVKAKSLNKYIDKYKPKYSIRISEKNFGYENNIKSIPLYAVHCIGKI